MTLRIIMINLRTSLNLGALLLIKLGVIAVAKYSYFIAYLGVAGEKNRARGIKHPSSTESIYFL